MDHHVATDARAGWNLRSFAHNGDACMQPIGFFLVGSEVLTLSDVGT